MVNRAAQYTTSIVLAHLLVNIVHGIAHRELGVGLTPIGSAFVIAIVLAVPLVALGLVWTTRWRKLAFILLSISMLGSLLFGAYHHFLVGSPDHIHEQPTNSWGTVFIVTAYGLLITEAIGAYIGVHFLRLAKQTTSSTRQSV